VRWICASFILYCVAYVHVRIYHAIYSYVYTQHTSDYVTYACIQANIYASIAQSFSIYITLFIHTHTHMYTHAKQNFGIPIAQTFQSISDSSRKPALSLRSAPSEMLRGKPHSPSPYRVDDSRATTYRSAPTRHELLSHTSAMSQLVCMCSCDCLCVDMRPVSYVCVCVSVYV
jgi:hypothetical protein